MNVTKIRLCWWVFLVVMCSLGITHQTHKAKEAIKQPSVPFSTVSGARVLPPLQNPVVACYNEPKCNLLAEAIVYEARGEPTKGQIAVAHVILNRKKDARWPNKVADVIKQPHQFSYIEDKHKQKSPTKDDWEKARKIAHGVISGAISSPVGDATHYHATHVRPKWAKKLDRVAHVGNHIFYKTRK